jgi:hypothetical protein
MRNKYKGYCFRCGDVVDPGKGHFALNKNPDKFKGIKWLTQCAGCAIQFRDTTRSVWGALDLVNKASKIKIN